MSQSGTEADIEAEGVKQRLLRNKKALLTPSTMFTKSLEAAEKKRGEMLRKLALDGNKEVEYIIAKAEIVSQEGKLSYSYMPQDWSPWFQETTSEDEVQELAMLQGLQAKLQHRGYDVVVTRAYQGGPEAKAFIHMSWNRPESYLLLGGCVDKSHMKTLSKITGVFLFSFMVCVCIGGFLVLLIHLLALWFSSW